LYKNRLLVIKGKKEVWAGFGRAWALISGLTMAWAIL
jgi:hypothetical protein